jgi:hypothetical protein
MDQALKFLQEVGEDPEAAVVPVEHVGKVFKPTKTIKKYADVPKYVMKMKHYFVIENPKAFNPVQYNNQMAEVSRCQQKCFSRSILKRYWRRRKRILKI